MQLPPSNSATKRLTELAQKLYDHHLKIGDVAVYAAGPSESVVIAYDQQRRPDKYWVHHELADETTWTWTRELIA